MFIMKVLNFEQMEIISAGGPGRTCMILGGVVTAAAIGAFVCPVLWGVVGVGTVNAATYGCFD